MFWKLNFCLKWYLLPKFNDCKALIDKQIDKEHL
jgi:hypothetical protein